MFSCLSKLSKLLVAGLAWAALLPAHDPGLSTASLQLEGGRLEAQLTFAPLDLDAVVALDADQDGEVTREEFKAARTDVERAARESLAVDVDGRAGVFETARASWQPQDDTDNVDIQIRFSVAPGDGFTAQSRWLAQLPSGHRQYLTLHDPAGNALAEKLLDAEADSVAAPLGQHSMRTGASTFREFTALGVEHIVTGYDHLLFLFGLLVVGGSFLGAAKIITSFTVAHSITLACATLGLVNLPPEIVEPLIAASIVYIGIENLFRRNLEQRWLLTFFFGLVHGLGFASVLRELGVGAQSGGITLPLLSFNLGVELGQIALAALVLPLIWALQRRPEFAVLGARACSWAITAMGLYWLVSRTLLS